MPEIRFKGSLHSATNSVLKRICIPSILSTEVGFKVGKNSNVSDLNKVLVQYKIYCSVLKMAKYSK